MTLQKADEQRRQRARENLDMLLAEGAGESGARSVSKAELGSAAALHAVQVNVALLGRERPACKMVPTCVAYVPEGALVLGAKSGELLYYKLPELTQTAAIEAGPPLRGPREARKHAYCAKYKGAGPALQAGHHGAVLGLAGKAGYVISAGADCLLNAREGPGESIFTLIAKTAPKSVAFTDYNIVVADGKILRVFSGPSEVIPLYGPTADICHLCSVPGQNAVLCASEDKSLRRFDLADFTQLIFTAQDELECCAALSADLYLAGGPAGVFLYSKDKRDALFHFLPGTHVNCIACCAGYNIACAGFRGGISVFYSAGSALSEVQRLECAGFVNGLCCFAQGQKIMLAACGGRERPADRFEVLRETSWLGLWELGSIQTVLPQKKRSRFQV